MKEKLVKKIVQASWHRNGIGGMGFWAVLFDADVEYLGKQQVVRMFAVVHEEPNYCSVVAVPGLSDPAIGVAFARGNSWRGDRFEEGLRAGIKRYEKKQGLAGCVKVGPFSIPTKE